MALSIPLVPGPNPSCARLTTTITTPPILFSFLVRCIRCVFARPVDPYANIDAFWVYASYMLFCVLFWFWCFIIKRIVFLFLLIALDVIIRTLLFLFTARNYRFEDAQTYTVPALVALVSVIRVTQDLMTNRALDKINQRLWGRALQPALEKTNYASINRPKGQPFISVGSDKGLNWSCHMLFRRRP